MTKQILFCIAVFLFSSFQSSSQNRTIDGSMNNEQDQDLGASGAQIQWITSYGFTDGYSTPGGVSRPNPRIISNDLFAQDSLLMDPLNLSDFTWVFGQFIDHDITSISNDPSEPVHIPVNFPDQYFNPGGAFPDINIFMFRSQKVEGTGTDISNPRQYTNNITSWIDGSGVYGSDEARAAYLRSFTDGKLRTSVGNLLPFNTTTGELNDPVDPNAPHMDNENPMNDKLFVAGDSRANENLLLTAFHTLFLREHNRLCDIIIAEHPDWTDEQLYQYARKINSGYIASIVFDEWLPVMGVDLPAYAGYNSSLNPNITNVFSVAAFRMGHTLLNSQVIRMDNEGNTIPEGNITLQNSFFNPLEVINAGGLNPLFKGMATQTEQDMDCKVIDDVRNFLFGPPQAGVGGLDLAAININRGRERGLSDFNTIRQDLGLTAYASFEELNSDPEVAAILEDLYGNVNDIDAWVGMLAEEHMQDALFGETIMEIMELQFHALRDGDRFYFENDPVLSQEEIGEIKNTTFRDIIMRNTGVAVMQMNVFEAMNHDSICPANSTMASISGLIQNENSSNVEGVSLEIIDLEDQTIVGTDQTEEAGEYLVDDLATCEHFQVRPEKDYNYGNGVSTFDLILIARHILQSQLLDSPYKIIAADINHSGTVSTFDLINMRKVILTLQDTFTSNTSWRFVASDYIFTDPANPLSEPFPESLDINYLSEDTQINFVGIKVGDVNGSANPAAFSGIDSRNEFVGSFIFEADDRKLETGEIYSVAIKAKDFDNLAGFQFTMNYDESFLSFEDLIPGDLNNLSKANFGIQKDENAIKASWNSELKTDFDGIVFTLQFKARKNGLLSDALNIDSRLLKAEAYTKALDYLDVQLHFNKTVQTTSSFELFQNQPNPFAEYTTISFNLPESGLAELRIFDLAGKELKTISQRFTKGFNLISLDRSDLLSSGVLYYQLNTDFGSLTKKMILIESNN